MYIRVRGEFWILAYAILNTVLSLIQAAACIKFLPLLLRLVFKGGFYSRAACIKFSLVQRRTIISFSAGWRTIPTGTLIFSRFFSYVKFVNNSQRDAIHLAWVNRCQNDMLGRDWLDLNVRAVSKRIIIFIRQWLVVSRYKNLFEFSDEQTKFKFLGAACIQGRLVFEGRVYIFRWLVPMALLLFSVFQKNLS